MEFIGTNLSSISLYTLAANPDLAPILREDVYQALQETDGQYTSLALQNMKKLDSFLKETLRYYPLSASKYTTLSTIRHMRHAPRSAWG